jgi:hypothetical protein
VTDSLELLQFETSGSAGDEEDGVTEAVFEVPCPTDVAAGTTDGPRTVDERSTLQAVVAPSAATSDVNRMRDRFMAVSLYRLTCPRPLPIETTMSVLR